MNNESYKLKQDGLSLREIVDADICYMESDRYDTDKRYWQSLMRERPKKQFAKRYYKQFSAQDVIPSQRKVLTILHEKHELLVEKAKHYNTSVSQVYLALVAMYFSQTLEVFDLILGSPTHNRNGFAQKKSLGTFVNVIPVALHVDIEDSLDSFLQQIKSVMLKNLRHQRFPIADLQRTLASSGSIESGLFELIFNYLKINARPIVAEYQSELVFLGNGNEQGPIKITVWEHNDSHPIKIHIDYNLMYFSSQDIDLLAKRLEWLIEQMAHMNYEHLSQFNIIPPEELKTLLHLGEGGINTALVGLAGTCIHELFEGNVSKSPDALAVIFGNDSITYRELNERSNQFAVYLRESFKVKPDGLVGLYLDRSFSLIIAIMGVLKSGAAYVPMDPNYPASRVEYMLDDAKISLVITQTSLLNSIDFSGREIVDIDKIELDAYATDNLGKRATGVTSSNLAYVMYTSGSTGKPKGVMIEHKQLVNFSLNICEYHQITNVDRILQFASTSFDIFIKEFLAAFCYGAALVFRSDECLSGPESFYKFCKNHRISVMSLPSAFWHQICEYSGELYPELKLVSAGGEEISLTDVRKWLSNSNAPMLVHGYGPTEVTVNAASSRLREELVSGEKIPIGKPNKNVFIYLLDSNRRMTPYLSVGEIYIGGAGVARGYFNKPELTAERFVSNPYYDLNSPNSPKILYKSGDFARYLPNGNLEFVGRIDEQVKIRGFRIELGEIENVLLAQPTIKDAAVVAFDRPHLGRYLVAFLVSKGNRPERTAEGLMLDSNEIIEALKKSLPEYMVPAYFIDKDYLPLSPNGKIDRKALLPPDLSKVPQKYYVAPTNSIEKMLVKIWSDVLHLPIDKISTKDNFFDLGGDSLLAMSVSAHANQLGYHIPTKILFEHKKIEIVAKYTVVIGNSATKTSIINDTPLSVSQKWFFSENYKNQNRWNLPFLFDLPHEINANALELSVQRVVHHHDSLRAVFVKQKNELKIQINELNEEGFVHYIDLSNIPVDSQNIKITEISDDLQNQLSIETGPLFLIRLIDLGQAAGKKLLFVFHHLIADGPSIMIIFRDIDFLYQKICEGVTSAQLQKTATIDDFYRAIHNISFSHELKDEANYWRSKNWDAVRNLPVDFDNYDNSISSGAKVSCGFDKDETSFFQWQLTRVYGVSIFDALISSLAHSISGWSNKDEVLISVIDAGRSAFADKHNLDMSRTVGWFSFTAPLFIKTRIEGSVLTRTKNISDQIAAIPNRGIGYDLLYWIKGDDIPPLYDKDKIILNYLGVLDSDESSMSGLFRSRSQLSLGANQDLSNDRSVMFMCIAYIFAGSLHIEWQYGSNQHSEKTIEGLIGSMKKYLTDLYHHHLEHNK